MSDKIKSTSKNGQTETKTYDGNSGQLKSIQHTDEKTGKTHEHNVGHGGALGLVGPFTGSKK